MLEVVKLGKQIGVSFGPHEYNIVPQLVDLEWGDEAESRRMVKGSNSGHSGLTSPTS